MLKLSFLPANQVSSTHIEIGNLDDVQISRDETLNQTGEKRHDRVECESHATMRRAGSTSASAAVGTGNVSRLRIRYVA